MPSTADINAYAASYESEEGADVAHTDLYNAVRQKYESYFRITHDQLGLASTAQTEPLKQWIDSIAPTNEKELLEADKWYRLDYSKKLESALKLYHGDFLPPLQRAVSGGVISSQSFNEWVQWVSDKGRDYKEKETSIWKVLPDYLDKRYKLAAKREALMRDKRFELLSKSNDPSIKATATKISDTDFFLSSLTFAQREAAIADALNALPLAETEVKLFHGFEKELSKAVDSKLISAGSKKKWIARFKDPSVNIRAKEYFVTSQFPSYVTAWQRAQKDRETIMSDPLFAELTSRELKDIGALKDVHKFLELHFDKRVGLIAEARAAITAHKESKTVLYSEARSVLESAASAGYISSSKVGPWLEHVISGARSLQELKRFVKDWAKVRYRYDKIEQNMVHSRVPQGMQRLSESAFTNLSYQQRLSYVEEAERRLDIQTGNVEDTPITDLKGKVRHALDTENWDEAEHYLRKAWSVATTEEDRSELQSMERHLKSFGKKSEYEMANEDADKEVAWAKKEIDTVLSLLPPSYQKLYRKALNYGAACLQCVTTCVYNRTWCQERGYLSEGLEDRLREQSIEETANRLRPSVGHANGLENNFVDGFNSPSIRDKGIGPQNAFVSNGGVDSFVEKANANKNTWSFWYWTNYIDNDVSASQNAYVSYALNHRIKRAARALERNGVMYSDVGAMPSVN